MSIQSIDHVQLAFPQGAQPAIRRFYGDLLGLTEAYGYPGPALRFVAGQQRLDLVPAEAAGRPAAPVHLALKVCGLSLLRERLLGAGVELDETHPLKGFQRAYLKDPGGNTLELLEPASPEVTP